MIGRTAGVALAVLAGVAAQEAIPELEVLQEPRCDGGNTSRIDLDRVERNYRDAARGLRQSLAGFQKKALDRLEDGYDAGLPDPSASTRSMWKPSTPLPEQLRGITIYIVTVDRDGKAHGLPRGGRGKEDVVLIARAARLKDCAPLAPVTFLTREFASTLRIRTSRGRCVVSRNGTQVEVTEGDQP
ncbi:MAG: hypothetical protein HYY17_13160 [Planctomycetes bacterium]|nr:hypothetical protein [Planctomycetota bacterium]